jgi:tetratricopeptide (TPR) repeat protein
MRVFKFFGIVFLFVLLSCNYSDNEYETFNAIILQADTIYQHPNGERYKTTEADTSDLSSQLMNASCYFLSRHDNKKASKAFLFCGYAQKEANDKASAMKSFKDAEYYGNISGDSLTTARAQFNIAKLLFDNNDYDLLLETALAADKNFNNNYTECAFLHNMIAASFIMQKDYENAEYYLKKALTYAEKGQSTAAKTNVLNNYSVFYREQGKYKDALNYLSQLKLIETDSIKLILLNLNTGLLYMYDNQYDSANYYTNLALNLSKSIITKPETKASIYFSLYYIAKKQGKYRQALEYFENYDALQYQIQKDYEKKSLYRIQRQYDYEALQNKMNQKIIAKQRIILTISVLLLLASIVVIWLMARQKMLLKEEERIKEELKKTQEDLQKAVKPEVVEKELSRQLHLILTANNIAKNADDFKKEWSTLVYRINNEQANMFEAALVAIERVYPGMYATIKQKYPKLNDTGAKVMLLSCSNLSNREIAKILGLSIHSVNKCKSEINKNI